MGKMGQGKWDQFKSFIDTWPTKEIRRSDLIENLTGKLSIELIDAYRLSLTNAGILRHAINPVSKRQRPGFYLIVKDVPKDLTLEQANEKAYPGATQRRRDNQRLRASFTNRL